MWLKTHSTIASDVTPEQIWAVWSDINKRHLWDTDIKWATIHGPFEKNAVFYMKPKGGPKLKMKIIECTPNKSFTDFFQFPFAKLYGAHSLEKAQEGLRLSTSIKIEGPLSFLWRKLVAEKIVATLPEQTEMLIKIAREQS